MQVPGSSTPSNVYPNLGYEEKTYKIWERITALALGILGALTVVGLFFPAVRKQFTIAFMGKTAEPIAVKDPKAISTEVSPAKTSQPEFTDEQIKDILEDTYPRKPLDMSTVKQGAKFVMDFMKQHGERVPATDIKITGTSSRLARRCPGGVANDYFAGIKRVGENHVPLLNYLLLTNQIGCWAITRLQIPIIHYDLNVTRLDQVDASLSRMIVESSMNKKDLLDEYNT